MPILPVVKEYLKDEEIRAVSKDILNGKNFEDAIDGLSPSKQIIVKQIFGLEQEKFIRQALKNENRLLTNNLISESIILLEDSIGAKSDYPKIDVYVDGKYEHSTNMAKNLRDDISSFQKIEPDIDISRIKAKYSKT